MKRLRTAPVKSWKVNVEKNYRIMSLRETLEIQPKLSLNPKRSAFLKEHANNFLILSSPIGSKTGKTFIIYSHNKLLLSACSTQGSALDSWDTKVDKYWFTDGPKDTLPQHLLSDLLSHAHSNFQNGNQKSDTVSHREKTACLDQHF